MKDGRQGENKQDFTQSDVCFTTKDGVLYAYVLAPPTEDIVIKSLASGGQLEAEIDTIELMGSTETIAWTRSSTGLTVQLPKSLLGETINGFRLR